MIGNPKHRKRKSSNRRRRHGRIRSRGLLSNPGAIALKPLQNVKEMVSATFLLEAASVAAGFVGPNMVIAHLPSWAKDATWKVYATKALTVASLSATAGIAAKAITKSDEKAKKIAKAVLLGGSMSILLDAWVDVIQPMIGSMTGGSKPTGTGAYYGPHDGVGSYYGPGTLADAMSDDEGSEEGSSF